MDQSPPSFQVPRNRALSLSPGLLDAFSICVVLIDL
jgi:hypothetical protein